MNNDDRGLFIWLSVISLALIIAVTLGAVLVRGNINGLQAQQMRSCEATNVIRAQDNASHVADFNVFQFVELRFSQPTKTETAAQRKITREFTGRLQMSLAAKTWAALSNCTAPSANTSEIELFQIAQRPPPSYATDLLNAAKPDPTGSIP